MRKGAADASDALINYDVDNKKIIKYFDIVCDADNGLVIRVAVFLSILRTVCHLS